MNKSVGDGRCGGASSLHMDLSNLVTWAHTHGAICSQIPALETAQSMDHPSKENALLWLCGAGHAYYWHCDKLDLRGREENEGVRKRPGSAEASSRKVNLNEKRFRMAPFFERAKADAASTGPCSTCPGIAQKDDAVCVILNEPPARENQQRSKSMTLRIAALSASGGEVNTDRAKVAPESDEDLQVVSDEEQCVLDGSGQGDRVSQNILSESPSRAAAALDLKRCRSQSVAFNKLTATRTSDFDPKGEAPPTPACTPKASTSDQESLDSSFLQLGPSNPPGSVTETSTARNSSRLVMPKEHLEPLYVSNTEVKAQLESPPSVTFFEFEATLDVKQQLQLSPPVHGTPGTGLGGNTAEHPAQEAAPSASGHAAHLSPSVSLGSENGDHPSASSSRSTLEKCKKKRNCGNIKVFKDWLVLHHPSETREIYDLPPQDLDNYLASFYSSAKSQKGTDFSISSLHFFRLKIEQYLKEHNYKYSVVRGVEFRASQEALKVKQQQLSQKEREGEWAVVERLTEEDVDGLCREGLLSKNHPQGLLSLMVTNIIRGFGAHTHSGSHTLLWGQLMLRQAEGELECLEWKDELGVEDGAGEPGPQLLARPDRPGNCPVMDYKEYAKRRPLDMCHAYDPLYLTPKPQCSVWDQVWFCRKALAKAKLEKILKVIIQEVKGPRKRPKT